MQCDKLSEIVFFRIKCVPNIAGHILRAHTYTKKYSLFIWNSNLTRHPVFLFARSDSPIWEDSEMEFSVQDVYSSAPSINTYQCRKTLGRERSYTPS